MSSGKERDATKYRINFSAAVYDQRRVKMWITSVWKVDVKVFMIIIFFLLDVFLVEYKIIECNYKEIL